MPRTQPVDCGDNGGGVLNSNSHYISNCHLGCWWRNGRLLRMFRCNDVNLADNFVDVGESGASVELGDAADSAAICTDVRIHGGGFYRCVTGIALRNVGSVTINGVAFFDSFDGMGWVPLEFSAGGATIVAGRINSVVVSGCIVSDMRHILQFGGSVRNLNFHGNAAQRTVRWLAMKLARTLPPSISPLRARALGARPSQA